jgi:nucleotide-binding universal stress UspA family protein
VDDSPAAALVLEQAGELGGEGTRLSLVHVGPVGIDLARSPWLEALARRMPGARAVVLEGLPGPEICAWAAAEAVDLLVAAPHDRTLRRRATLGSVTRHLVDRAPCPVLVARERS